MYFPAFQDTPLHTNNPTDMPKLMGYLGDQYNMSIAFAVPLGCFALIFMYGYAWPVLASARPSSTRRDKEPTYRETLMARDLVVRAATESGI
jgi:hypothetical protein